MGSNYNTSIKWKGRVSCIEGFKPIVDVDHFPAIQVSLEEDSSSQSAFSGEL